MPITEPEPLQQVDRTYVLSRTGKLSYFSGCDYFRLGSHPRVLAALETGARRYGMNVAASRLTTGNHLLYSKLETRLARFFGAEAALLVSSGYVTNLVVAQAWAGSFSHALLDEEAHTSLRDAARFLDCPVLQFGHRDSKDLAAAVRRCSPGAKLALLTDGMFSRDGSAAPLREYLKVLPRDAQVLVDDSHGAGVLGRTGKGTLEHAGVGRKRVLQTITLSKAFGVYGGAILGSRALRRRIFERSHLFVGSTPPPLPLANAALQSVELLDQGSLLHRHLAENSDLLKQSLRHAGLPVPEAPGPIIALLPRGPAVANKMKAALLAAGIYPPFIKYPGGPPSGYFRFVISSEHTRAQLGYLIAVLSRFAGSVSSTAKDAS